LCEKALKGGNKLVQVLRTRRLSGEAKDLFRIAARRGEFHLMSVEEIPGSWIRASGRIFLKEDDPAYAVRYIDALKDLCERGYVQYQGGTFILTGSGFSKVKKLVDRS
jgi:hypothetical protein